MAFLFINKEELFSRTLKSLDIKKRKRERIEKKNFGPIQAEKHAYDCDFIDGKYDRSGDITI